ncbi:Uncharacterised protein [Serratia proteamaculans]|nr:Uncharacterised protein [Serratia proteamaculans]CAI2538828.1 Uncharacterised protein [Serratia proteamaculans]
MMLAFLLDSKTHLNTLGISGCSQAPSYLIPRRLL